MTLQTVLDDIAARPGTGEPIAIINPATEEPIAEFTDGGVEGVNDAVARARASFESGLWSGKPGNERAKVLWRIADLIDEHAADLAEIDSFNTGRPYMQARMITSTRAEMFRHYAGWCTKLEGIAHDVQQTGGITARSPTCTPTRSKSPMAWSG